MKARTKLLRRLQDEFRRYRPSSVDRIIARVNPMQPGWAYCFRIGQSSRCFSHVKDRVEKKVKRP